MFGRMTHNEFLIEIEKLNPNIEIKSEYRSKHEKILCVCKKCGHEWQAETRRLLAGSGCANCYHASQKNKPSRNGLQKSHEEFIDDLQKKNPNGVKIIGKYTTARNPIEWECRQCGKHTFSSPKHLYTSSGLCKDCVKQIVAQNTIQKNEDTFLEKIKKQENAPIMLEGYKGMLVPIKVQCKKCGHIWEAIPSNLIKYTMPCPKCAIKSRTKEHAEFISELKSLNPNIEIIGTYKTALTTIQCKCLLCGYTWEQKPNALLNGIGCPNCNHASTSLIEQIILLALQEAYPNKTILSRDRTKIGQELDIYIPEDQVAIEYGAWHWHKDKIKEDLEKKRICEEKGIRLIIIFDACKTVPAGMDIHDVIFYPQDLGRNLQEARKMLERVFNLLDYQFSLSDEQFLLVVNKAYTLSRKSTTTELIIRMQEINPSIEIIGDYKGSQKPINCKCRICGHTWSPVPDSLVQGHGCPKCSGHFTKRLSTEEYKQRLAAKHPFIELLEPYTNGRDEKQFLCTKCGYSWRAQPKAVLHGRGCKKCNINEAAQKRSKNKKINL